MTTQPLTSDAAQLMAEALKQTMPGLKTQAQFTAFMFVFDALRVLCDAICSGRSYQEAQAVFEKALEALKTATELSHKFEEFPEAVTRANPFTTPPVQFQEYDIQKKLLSELSRITSLEELNIWYSVTKVERDSVISQNLRNILMDAIRTKKEIL